MNPHLLRRNGEKAGAVPAGKQAKALGHRARDTQKRHQLDLALELDVEKKPFYFQLEVWVVPSMKQRSRAAGLGFRTRADFGEGCVGTVSETAGPSH